MKIVVATSSLNTRWIAYSQTLLAYLVPEWHRIVIDGRRAWSPTQFIDSTLKLEADYIVHVDEDCFVASRSVLIELIDVLEKDPTIAAAGIPDGGHYYRDYNPAALNLFFVVFRASSLRRAISNVRPWQSSEFDPAFSAEVSRQRPDLDHSRINWEKHEPYYPIFWSLLETGKEKFLYLGEHLDRDRWSTQVMAPSGELICEHLWYLRACNSSEVMPGHDCPNNRRYAALRAELWQRYKGDWRFGIELCAQQARRTWACWTG